MSNKSSADRKIVRCAVYTRKSTEEGLDQEFNTLDAQRESGEAYVKSQASEGWECLPEHYDDGGFTGGNMERPALRRLMTDIQAGRVDCVVVYKVDRLSRSLLDFARMMEVFDRHRVAFVSVTQQFNTSSSMGRLVLNVLLSFAQFEREIISERTRDKIAAARRRGKWSGGMPILGYDVDPRGSKLVVNDDEAARVRAIFDLYLDRQTLLATAQELERRAWSNKHWTTRKGTLRGGKPFTKTSLHKLLTNVTYVGKLRYKKEIHKGEHDGIVAPETWERVQALLRQNGLSGNPAVRNKYGALLKGILRCAPCGCLMTPSHTTRGPTRRYRYYVCSSAQKRGWHSCPSKSVPAGQIEQFVVDQIKCIGRDPDLIAATVAKAQQQGKDRLAELNRERQSLERQLARWNTDIRSLVDDRTPAGTDRLADLIERVRGGEQSLQRVTAEIAEIPDPRAPAADVARALAEFTPIWDALAPREQCRVIQLLVERVDYDGAKGTLAITFHPTGIQALTNQIANREREDAA